jgi:opacity protein-like surface antigen
MKRVLWLIPAIIFLVLPAKAQNAPAWEVSGGYSYARANLGAADFALNGGYGSVTENVNGWFGGRLEANFYEGSQSGNSFSAQTYTYGPVFSYRKFERITPYIQVQLGAIHANAGFLGISQPAWKFALAPGGGLDLNLNERVAVRVQANYLMTRFLSGRQDNIAASAGLVFRFGHK